MIRKIATLAAILQTIFIVPFSATAEPSQSKVNWQQWSETLFEQAKKENRLVILDLEAIWCHWCHVMDHETYSNPEVSEILNSKFISVKVDQDSRPDLSVRYQDYGWPATIIFNSKGEELAKLSGFIEPKEMLGILKNKVANPVPESEDSVQDSDNLEVSGNLSDEIRKALTERHYSTFDTHLGGLLSVHKYLDAGSTEYQISLALKNSARDAEMAKQSLTANLKLMDPAWGGVYQYSTHSDWEHPHFEKIMSSQAENLRLYSLAFSVWKDPNYLEAAIGIYSYLKSFLTDPDGAFYTSQDADLVKGVHSHDYFQLDDAGRRKQGIPAIDKHIYSRENGWAIESSISLYSATVRQDVLDHAIKAANWILANRSLPGGGFRHDEKDVAGPYLGDTLAMGRAFLAIYSVTADRIWLSRAQECLKFISSNFVTDDGSGYYSAKFDPSAVIKPVKLNDENIMLARFANLLHHYTGNTQFKDAATYAMKYLAIPKIALRQRVDSGILLADSELSMNPMHITIVGGKSDQIAQELFKAAVQQPSTYKRIEWWDTKEGTLPNPDVQYPQLDRAAAFICTNKRCSLPIFKPEGIQKTLDQFKKL